MISHMTSSAGKWNWFLKGSGAKGWIRITESAFYCLMENRNIHFNSHDHYFSVFYSLCSLKLPVNQQSDLPYYIAYRLASLGTTQFRRMLRDFPFHNLKVTWRVERNAEETCSSFHFVPPIFTGILMRQIKLILTGFQKMMRCSHCALSSRE